jgi:N-acetylglucosaminyldiphosphoundecaprenol N-acetyl-beta-D-mannosaminyltransferase
MLKVKIYNDYPHLNIAGFVNPGKVNFDENDVVRISNIVSESNANIVWISLGTPLQDMISTELSLRNPGAFIGVGAAFGFLSGSDKEAPSFLKKVGLEWFFRFIKEPRRLWRRYLLLSPLGAYVACTKRIQWTYSFD